MESQGRKQLKSGSSLSRYDPACWCSLYFIRILKRSSTLLGFPTREANRESTIRRLWSGFSFCMIFINSQSMTSSALVKGKPESVPAGFVSEASILRSGWIWYSSNSFSLNRQTAIQGWRSSTRRSLEESSGDCEKEGLYSICCDRGIGGGIYCGDIISEVDMDREMRLSQRIVDELLSIYM